MTYIKRHSEKTIDTLSKMFGAVLVTGARQVGKTTMLERFTEGVPALTFDDAAVVEAASTAPELFFEYNKPPVFLDEIQKAPDLFPEIKMRIDKSKKKGLFYMSGSQQFEMMAQVSESLSGRIGILNLLGLSLREEAGDTFDDPFLPCRSAVESRRSRPAHRDAQDVWNRIHRGSMPELIANPDFDWAMYYGTYVRTYIERDVRQIVNVTDIVKFQAFIGAAAARTGGILNIDDIAKDVGISAPTANKWLSILQATNIVYLLRPYHTNATKRAVKTPKLYFTDTGLAAYLTKWSSGDVLSSGAMAGAFFETFVVTEILKSYYNSGIIDPPIYFYRDKDKREIDILIEKDGVLYPVEVKRSGAPNMGDIKAFGVLDKLYGVKRGEGGVVCFADKLLPLGETDSIIPLEYL
jgi:predicted AAA+ superfamily ATPase